MILYPIMPTGAHHLPLRAQTPKGWQSQQRKKDKTTTELQKALEEIMDWEAWVWEEFDQ